MSYFIIFELLFVNITLGFILWSIWPVEWSKIWKKIK